MIIHKNRLTWSLRSTFFVMVEWYMRQQHTEMLKLFINEIININEGGKLSLQMIPVFVRELKNKWLDIKTIKKKISIS